MAITAIPVRTSAVIVAPSSNTGAGVIVEDHKPYPRLCTASWSDRPVRMDLARLPVLLSPIHPPGHVIGVVTPQRGSARPAWRRRGAGSRDFA
jgi:hypothetical protein